jgi:hypothetical protein
MSTNDALKLKTYVMSIATCLPPSLAFYLQLHPSLAFYIQLSCDFWAGQARKWATLAA